MELRCPAQDLTSEVSCYLLLPSSQEWGAKPSQASTSPECVWCLPNRLLTKDDLKCFKLPFAGATLKPNGSSRDAVMPSTHRWIWSRAALLEPHNNFHVLHHCFQHIKLGIFFPCYGKNSVFDTPTSALLRSHGKTPELRQRALLFRGPVHQWLRWQRAFEEKSVLWKAHTTQLKQNLVMFKQAQAHSIALHLLLLKGAAPRAGNSEVIISLLLFKLFCKE